MCDAFWVKIRVSCLISGNMPPGYMAEIRV